MTAIPEYVDQLGLFVTSRAEIEKAFWEFHDQNPDVYRELVRFARQAKGAGRSRFGIGMLWERLRWYSMVETTDPSKLKLNNNYRSRYARLIMSLERCSTDCTGCQRPECLAGMFETRELDQPTALEVLP